MSFLFGKRIFWILIFLKLVNSFYKMSIKSFFKPKSSSIASISTTNVVNSGSSLGATAGVKRSSDDAEDSDNKINSEPLFKKPTTSVLTSSSSSSSLNNTTPFYWEPFHDKVNGTWLKLLDPEVQKPYFRKLATFVDAERKKHTIFPPSHHTFSALNYCSFEDVKVVIIGQDPYHGPNQAHGLCFSVLPGIPPPPSLKNIYKELETDLKIPKAKHGFLESWSQQGVLMLNACLSVRKGEANSHQKKGWETFTDTIITKLSKNHPGLVFLLWGKPAQTKCASINRSKHKVITSSHPSPLGATKTNEPFIGSKCFSRCNAELQKMGREPIDWKLPTY